MFKLSQSQRRTIATVVLACTFALALLSPSLTTPRRAAAAPLDGNSAVLNFPATGHAVKTAGFVNFFQAYGGVPTFGYPLAEETWENGRLVQYFERQRFELHPENAGSPYEVLLGRLGAEAATGRTFATAAPFADSPGRAYIAATHHALAEPFLSYWHSHGDVRILGYPISELIAENGLQVQYFERARMERHPENAGSPYEVLLSQLGKGAFDKSAAAATGAAPAAGVNDMEAQLLGRINAARQAAGLRAVSLDPQLISLARDRAGDMANRHYFSHVTPDGQRFLNMMQDRNIGYALAGEIIAQNNYPTVQSVEQAYQGYMNSAEHRAIIMMDQWTLVGVGQALDGNGMYYYTVIFLQPR
ncbi:MAG: CAP domain-containing protein [Chloroflexota bacterium]|nr:CAP domain-containing protein [Chloroflexota bacterium]